LYPGNPNVIGPLTLTFDLVSNLGLSEPPIQSHLTSVPNVLQRSITWLRPKGHVTCVDSVSMTHTQISRRRLRQASYF